MVIAKWILRYNGTQGYVAYIYTIRINVHSRFYIYPYIFLQSEPGPFLMSDVQLLYKNCFSNGPSSEWDGKRKVFEAWSNFENDPWWYSLSTSSFPNNERVKVDIQNQTILMEHPYSQNAVVMLIPDTRELFETDSEGKSVQHWRNSTKECRYWLSCPPRE